MCAKDLQSEFRPFDKLIQTNTFNKWHLIYAAVPNNSTHVLKTKNYLSKYTPILLVVRYFAEAKKIIPQMENKWNDGRLHLVLSHLLIHLFLIVHVS